MGLVARFVCLFVYFFVLGGSFGRSCFTRFAFIKHEFFGVVNHLTSKLIFQRIFHDDFSYRNKIMEAFYNPKSRVAIFANS